MLAPEPPAGMSGKAAVPSVTVIPAPRAVTVPETFVVPCVPWLEAVRPATTLSPGSRFPSPFPGPPTGQVSMTNDGWAVRTGPPVTAMHFENSEVLLSDAVAVEVMKLPGGTVLG